MNPHLPPPALHTRPAAAAAAAAPPAAAAVPFVSELARLFRQHELEMELEITASRARHSQSQSSLRCTLRSPFKDAQRDTQQGGAADCSAAPASSSSSSRQHDRDDAKMGEAEAAASSSAAVRGAWPAAAPSLPLPFPHRNAPSANILHRLAAREVATGNITRTAFKRSCLTHRFGRIQLKRNLLTYDPDAADVDLLNVQQKVSKVNEIVACGDIVFALTQSGICVAYDRRTFTRLCYLNVISDEVIRSLFYNKVNQSLISVSVYKHDNFTSLRCRSTTLNAISLGKPECGTSLFTSESLQWPGFVEFDDVNKKILTFSSQSGRYKVWELSTYRLLYDIHDPLIEEVKISPGIMLLILKKTRNNKELPMRLVAMDSGEVLREWLQPLDRKKKVEFIEQFNEKMLLKQKKAPLQFVDVNSPWKDKEISDDVFPAPASFIFLYENQLFLTFYRREIAVWNFEGEKITTFEDHVNWFPECNTNNIFISVEQDLIVSYCLTASQAESMRLRHNNPALWQRRKKRTGTINISSIFTGKCIAKIEKLRPVVCPPHLLAEERTQANMEKAANRCREIEGEMRAFDARDAAAAAAGAGPQDPARVTLGRHARLLTTELQRTMQLMRNHDNHAAAAAATAAAHNGAAQTPPSTAAPVAAASSSAAAAAGAAASAPPPPPHRPVIDLGDYSMDDDDANAQAIAAAAADDSSGHSTDRSSDESDTDDDDNDSGIHGGGFSEVRPRRSHTPSGPARPPSLMCHSMSQLVADEYPLTDAASYRTYNRLVSEHNAALKDVTAVFFNEERNEIYTGNKAGHLYVWAH